MSESQQNEKKPVSALLALGILFIPYIFSWFTLKKGYSQKAKLISFAWLGFIILIAINSGKNQNSGKTESTLHKLTNDRSDVENAVIEISDSCEKVTGHFDANSRLSDLQKDELFKNKYRNKVFQWDLKVVEVSSETLGSGYTVQFKCKNSSSFIQDIVISFNKSQKNTVIQMTKGSVYRVKGKLTMQSTLLGLTADAF